MLFSYMKYLITALLLTTTFFATAQETQQIDDIDKAIISVYQSNKGSFLCMSSDSSLPEVRKSVDIYLRNNNIENPSVNDAAKAAYTLFPCPFSPYRNELRHSTQSDIEGVWLYPEASQKLRFGPKSPMWSKFSATPIKCEAVAYYSDGEARNAQILGNMACPFSNAKDMDVSRFNPKVTTWKIIRDGILKISRTDVQDHLEEWEMFTVVKPFEVAAVQFKEGDLVAYLRRERGGCPRFCVNGG